MEPDYAQAYAMMAAAYSYLGATGQMLPGKAFEIVHRYADKALELDDYDGGRSYCKSQSLICFMNGNGRKHTMHLQKAIATESRVQLKRMNCLDFIIS